MTTNTRALTDTLRDELTTIAGFAVATLAGMRARSSFPADGADLHDRWRLYHLVEQADSLADLLAHEPERTTTMARTTITALRRILAEVDAREVARLTKEA